MIGVPELTGSRRRPARCWSRCRNTRSRPPWRRGVAAADARLGQHQFDAPRGLPVAGERGDDGADLLVAGAQQERRRAAVALHADDIDTGIGVGELVDPVRRHRAARVQVGIDQRRQRAGRLDAIVEVEPQLAQQLEIRAEAGGGDHLVGDDLALTISEHQRAVTRPDRAGLKAGRQCDRAVLDERADRGAERTPRRQLVRSAAAVLATRSAAADRPHDLRRGLGLAQCDEVQEHVERRVPAADHDDAPTRIAPPLRAEHVGNPVGDPIGQRGLAAGRQPGAERIRARPRTGGVDDRGGQIPALDAGLVDEQLEGRLVAARVLELVDPGAGDTDDPGVESQRRRELGRRGERLQIARDELVAGRVAGPVGHGPAVALEQRHRHRDRRRTPTARTRARAPTRECSRRPRLPPQRRAAASRGRADAPRRPARRGRHRSPRRAKDLRGSRLRSSTNREISIRTGP